MIYLAASLQDLANDSFARTLKQELQSLPAGSLPLEQAVTQGGMVDDANITVSVLHHHADEQTISARLAVFFTEVVICCGCGDDPMETHASCEMQVTIQRDTGEACFSLLDNQAEL